MMEALGTYIFTWSWQMAVLVLFAWIAVSLDRQHRPALRHRLLVLTLFFGCLLPWVPERIAALSWTQNARQVLTPVAAPTKAEAQDARRVFAVPESSSESAQPVDVTFRGTALPGWRFSQATLFQAVGFVWIAGAAIAAFRKLREYWRLHRIASNARTLSGTTPRVLLSPDVRSPMLYGWLRPVILLPENVSEWSTPEERATMIHHESAHFARKDHWISAFEAVVRTVFFFHPLVRWTCRQIDIERELACDEEVLRCGVEPAVYAEAILKVAEYSAAGKVTCGVYFAETAHLDRRVDLLFRPPIRVARGMVLLLPVFLLVAPTLALGFWQARVESLAPIEFHIEVNPPELIPEEILAPAPKPVAVRSQNPPVPPAAPEPQTVSRGADLAFMKVTDEITMANITLGIPHSGLVFRDEVTSDGTVGRRARGHVSMQVVDMTGRVVRAVDDDFEVVMLAAAFNPNTASVYQKTLYMLPRLHRLMVVISDSIGGTTSSIDTALRVPAFPVDRLAASSLILADLVEQLPPGQDPLTFRIGNFRVRPNLAGFRRDQNLHIFQQVYPSERDAGSPLPLAMEILITLDGREIRRTTEQVPRSEAAAVTRSVPLTNFAPGVYAIQTTYTDPASGEQVVSTAQFSVK